ncbi:MAG TPA: EcsC family protein [Gordonia sp. (in: high G+C Gram-positive bacteria)]|uniref:EcsC family protein n=1 Tax=unclassified Gordonia (in: high G+C Gram-positive bacteria) TaxID=2657482 RepID=UPI0025B82288|nr:MULTISPECIES: EcsC family protein [unclassified Gordonia (in: high G+C Gram-positive bacteria)]HNP57058.1 EcsC family protein [Gordonia sp. (in: high G+C Gram-positive bacteria)]HRC49405.1 EcsC family protein [Gordonia sp. (in: high G+C Gram-positive bacteria)]
MAAKNKKMSDGDGSRALELVENLLARAVHGAGPYKSAAAVADEALRTHSDPERAIQRLYSSHRRLVGVTGFASGSAGLIAMPVTIPADVLTFYVTAARMVAAIAHIRGYDVDSEEVRTGILLSLLGAGAGAAVGQAGAKIGNKIVIAQLGRLPGSVLTKINQAVGFRLVTKFGAKGVINLAKVVPVVGGGVGAGVNVGTLKGIYAYSNRLFVPLPEDGDVRVVEVD